MTGDLTAQDLFAGMLKERVAPFLRKNGFKGSGQRYRLPVPGHIVMVGFQKMRFGTHHDLMFTVNLLAVAEDAWEAYRATHPHVGKVPVQGGMYDEPVWSERIGFLMDDPHDHWWHVLDDTDIVAVGDEVIAALRDLAIPAIRARLGLDVTG